MEYSPVLLKLYEEIDSSEDEAFREEKIRAEAAKLNDDEDVWEFVQAAPNELIVMLFRQCREKIGLLITKVESFEEGAEISFTKGRFMLAVSRVLRADTEADKETLKASFHHAGEHFFEALNQDLQEAYLYLAICLGEEEEWYHSMLTFLDVVEANLPLSPYRFAEFYDQLPDDEALVRATGGLLAANSLKSFIEEPPADTPDIYVRKARVLSEKLKERWSRPPR